MSDILIFWFVLPALLVSALLALWRLIKGPTLADRVVALDLMTSIGIAIVAVYAIYTDTAVLLDIALVSALLAFLSTVAFAYFLERYR